jgi:hypothetical protein
VVVFGQGTGIDSSPAQVFQDGVHDVVVEKKGEDLHLSAAARASQGIDLEDALQELGPASAAGLQGGPVGELGA